MAGRLPFFALTFALVAPTGAFGALAPAGAFAAFAPAASLVSVETDPPPHPSIEILGDAGFAGPLSGVVSGSGTAGDPFVIGPWLLVQTLPAAIRLEGTRAHVVIRDVYVRGDEGWPSSFALCITAPESCHNGIRLRDAENVTFENVRLYAHYKSVEVRESRNVTMRDVRIGTAAFHLTSPGIGIHVVDSRDVTVQRLVSRGAHTPFATWRSDRVLLLDADLVGGPGGFYPRLSFGHGTDILVARSRLADLNVNFQEMGRVAFIENDWPAGDRAISWFPFGEDRFDEITLCGNRIARQTGYAAVNLEGVGRAVVVGNTFEGNGRGARITAGALEFHENVVRDSAERGLVLISDALLAHGNSFLRNAAGVTILGPTNPADATGNWWGDASGPAVEGASPTGSGDRLWGAGTKYAPWLASAPSRTLPCDALPARGTAAPAPQLAAEAKVERFTVRTGPHALP